MSLNFRISEESPFSKDAKRVTNSVASLAHKLRAAHSAECAVFILQAGIKRLKTARPVIGEELLLTNLTDGTVSNLG